MSRSFDPDDLAALGETFAEDLRSAFPEVGLPEQMIHDHVAAMITAARLLAEEGESVPDAVSHPSPRGLTTQRRNRMRGRMIRRVVAVATGLLLSLGGLAIAGAFTGSDDPGDDDQAVLVDEPDDNLDVADEAGEAEEADDADDADEAEDAEEAEDADDADEAEDADENEDADDQGEDADDQGEDADDQGEDADDEDADDDANHEDEGDHDGGGSDEEHDSEGGGSDD